MKIKNFKISQDQSFDMSFRNLIDGKQINDVEKRFLLLVKKKQNLKLPLSESEKKYLE